MEIELMGREKMSIEKRLVRAKVQLLMKQPFFGTLSYHLRTKEISGDAVIRAFVPTAGVDGKYLYYNKEWLGKHTDEEIQTIVAHEVLHVALRHLERRGHRNRMKFNAAADYAVNDILHEAGFTLPEACLYDQKYHNMNAEKIYELLPEQEYPVWDVIIEAGRKKEKRKEGEGEEDKTEVPITADPEELRKWRIYVAEAAAVARMRGKLPAGIDELLKDVLQPKINWREVLKRFIISNYKNDYSFLPPSKRHIHNGLVLPSLKNEGIGVVVMGIDVSGSISTEDAKQFFGEVQGVLDSYDVELHVLQHDVAVQKHDTYYKGDVLGEVEIKGRGGTSHIPLFEYVQQENIQPVCMVCLTDAYSEFPEEVPEYPVLWVLTPEHGSLPEWGERIVLE